MKTPFLILIFILLLLPPAHAQELHHNATFTGTTTISGAAITVPASGNLVGTTDAQSITNKTYNGLTITTTNGTFTLGSGKTLMVSNTVTLTGTDGSTVALGAGGTVAYVANNLGVFAAPTSAQLAGVITDATGTGSLVFATSPALVTPSLGVATATSINGLTFTGATGTGNLVYQTAPTINSPNLSAANFVGTSTIANSAILSAQNGSQIVMQAGSAFKVGSVTMTFPTSGAIVGTTDTQTLTNKSIAAASNTLTYLRSGSGMATRTLNAEIDESPITSKGAAAAFDNTTDDTTALQRQINSKGELRFSMGAAKTTDVLTLSTVGQILKGSGIPERRRQWHADQSDRDRQGRPALLHERARRVRWLARPGCARGLRQLPRLLAAHELHQYRHRHGPRQRYDLQR